MDVEESLVLTVVLGSLMMFVLVLTIITFVVMYSRKMAAKNNTIRMALKNRELDLLRKEIETQESEREKIAANIHDEIGPLLTTHRLNLSLLIHDLKDGVLTPQQIKKEQTFLDDVIESVRAVSHDLTPHFLLKMGLKKSLTSYFMNVPKTIVNVNITIDETKISKTVTKNVYRIVLELTNNLIKHDTPSCIDFEGTLVDETLAFKITHNSKGISNEDFAEFTKLSYGLGLNSIQSRLILVNGKLNFVQADNESQIELHIPIK